MKCPTCGHDQFKVSKVAGHDYPNGKEKKVWECSRKCCNCGHEIEKWVEDSW